MPSQRIARRATESRECWLDLSLVSETIGSGAGPRQVRLGARFDIRAFHDALLAEGHLPLSLVRARMTAWVEEQARKP